MKRRIFGLTVAAGIAAASQGWANEEACSCQNLESLQQEVVNAEYEAKFFNDMAGKLKAIEDRLTEAHKDPTHPDSSVDIKRTSITNRDLIMKGFKLPHLPAKGYTGPATVDMTPYSCEQPQAMLDAMRKGSQCGGIADITLRHEAEHRAKCNAMGAKPYWDRLPGEIAAEEAERYQQQAREMRELLKKVIDDGSMTVEATLTPRITGPQFDVTYSYVTPKAELKGKSSPNSDTWTLNGKTTHTGRITQARIAGMSCTSTGQINNDLELRMETDGFTMSLTGTQSGKPGDTQIRCTKGFGMSQRPPNESGSGSYFDSLPLKAETEFSQEAAELPGLNLFAGSGFKVSGKQIVKMKLVCAK